jgi:catechol 2,3-dioxygenase-like lactoylglutathione lyase family enzyme
MSIPARMSFVTIGARDLPRMREFYKGLGWKAAIEDGDNFVSFLLGGVVLGLYRMDLLTEEAAPGLAADGGWSGITLSINVATREEVDQVWAAAVAAGATPIAEPVDHPYGPRSGYVADPEGNRWEIAWAEGLAWDERGAVTKFGG